MIACGSPTSTSKPSSVAPGSQERRPVGVREAWLCGGFWSLTLYNRHHFFAPNELKRYSLGTKSKSMKPNADGSLTIYVQRHSVDRTELWNDDHHSPRANTFSRNTPSSRIPSLTIIRREA
jgi:hypothetical protein